MSYGSRRNIRDLMAKDNDDNPLGQSIVDWDKNTKKWRKGLSHLFFDAAATHVTTTTTTCATGRVLVFASTACLAPSTLIRRLMMLINLLVTSRRNRNDSIAVASLQKNDTRWPTRRFGFPVKEDILFEKSKIM